ncbi:hypothetical protein B0J14DRAFT_565220 [Halenospora varia]|nr:hypothetical protein B0J14DRAFT_565220 [Halenospora varia]
MADHPPTSRREQLAYLRYWYRLHSIRGLTPPPLSDELRALDNSMVALRVSVVATGSSNLSPIKIDDDDDEEDTIMTDAGVDSAAPPLAVAHPSAVATPAALAPPLAVAYPVAVAHPVVVAQPPRSVALQNSNVWYGFQVNFGGRPILHLDPASPIPTSMLLPTPKCLLSFFTSDDKLSCMSSKADDDCNYKALAVGDVFRIKGKEATLVTWQGSQMWVAVEGNADRHKVNGPSNIAKALGFVTRKRWPWADVDVYRSGLHLGTLQEIRQAWSFRNQEFNFRGMLTFTPTHTYKLPTPKEDDGYQVISQSGLYRKILLSEYQLHNQALMLDFGPVLNNALQNLAEPGYTIVPIDMRVLKNDGICAPSQKDLENTYNKGPEAFSTNHCRTLAAGAGYSNGHASLGPLALAKGFNTTDGPRWSRKRGGGGNTDSLDAFANRVPNSWFEPSSADDVGVETAPGGAEWTQFEIFRVTRWHKEHIERKIIHDPIPVTRLRLLEIGQHQRQVPTQPLQATPNAPVQIPPAPNAPISIAVPPIAPTVATSTPNYSTSSAPAAASSASASTLNASFAPPPA